LLDLELFKLASHTSLIVEKYDTDEMEKIRAVSFALMDCMDYCWENNLDLEKAEEILRPVYKYLGD
jgi:hypothetical protein